MSENLDRISPQISYGHYLSSIRYLFVEEKGRCLALDVVRGRRLIKKGVG